MDVIIVTTDDDLLIELGPVFDAGYRSRPLEKVAELPGLLQGRRSVVVLDTSGSADTRAAYAQLTMHHREVPILVIANAASRAAWESALQRGAIRALLMRDEDLRNRFAKVLQGAALVVAQLPAANSSTAVTDTVPALAPAGTGMKRAMMIGAAVIVLLLGAVLAWMWHVRAAGPGAATGVGATRRAAAAAAPGSRPAPTQSVSQLMSAARMAFSEQHYLEPAGSSALEVFTRVLQIDPGNAEARDGVMRLFGIIRSRADLAIKAGHLDEAESLLAAVRAAAPDSDLAKDLGKSIATEKPKWLTNQFHVQLAAGDLAGATQSLAELGNLASDRKSLQELQRELDARQQDGLADSEAASIRALIASGNLLDPVGGNAQAALASLSPTDRRNSAILAVQRELQLALIARARDAVREGRLDLGERYLNAATELGSAPDLTEARQQLTAAQEAVERNAAATRAAAAAAAAPAADTAPKSEPVYVKFKVRRAAEAAYPAAAKAARMQGFVDVKFNISPTGKAYNLAVLQANPPGVFDAAALESVSKTQFEPIVTEPGADAPLARLRISFKLQ
ncbi:MAG TPA: TonB family protein [Steroidobacteraceae bacterium]|nr:TonB family protein [Steroidobacteraceae bacterium]